MPERTGERAVRRSRSDNQHAEAAFAAEPRQPELQAPDARPHQLGGLPASPTHPEALDAAGAPAPAPEMREEPGSLRPVGEARSPIDLARLAWLVTVATLLTGTVILALRGDVGYAIVAAVVALSAAINLL